MARTATHPGFLPRKKPINPEGVPFASPHKLLHFIRHPGFLLAFASTSSISCQLVCSDMFLKWVQRRQESALGGQQPMGPSQGHPGPACVYFSHSLWAPALSLPQRLASTWQENTITAPYSTWDLPEPGMSSVPFSWLVLVTGFYVWP